MSTTQNVITKKKFYGIDDFQNHDGVVSRTDYSSKNGNLNQLKNNKYNFANSSYIENQIEEEEEEEDVDDEDLEEEAEYPVDIPGSDFNEIEEEDQQDDDQEEDDQEEDDDDDDFEEDDQEEDEDDDDFEEDKKSVF
jgi:hypothetical protein